MAKKIITPDMIVADVLRHYPQTMMVFQKYKMGCVGCSMAPFETLAEAVAIYRISLCRFMNELQTAVQWYGLINPGHHAKRSTREMRLG